MLLINWVHPKLGGRWCPGRAFLNATWCSLEIILLLGACPLPNECGAANDAVSSSQLTTHTPIFTPAWRRGLELTLRAQSVCLACSFMVVKINWHSVASPADSVPGYSRFLKSRKTLVQWGKNGQQLCFKKAQGSSRAPSWYKDATSGVASPKGSRGQPMPRSAAAEIK